MGQISGAVRADRAVGAVVVSACGDALGAAYEFGPALSPDTVVRMEGGGSFGWDPGEWTDDTQMATAVLASLAAPSAEPVDAIEAGFRTWYASGPADIGNQTRDVLSRPAPLAETAAEVARRNPEASGNGSLMRTGPVALAHPHDPAAIADFARRVPALTHTTNDCVDACVLWSIAIDHAIHHAPLSDEPYDWADVVRTGLDHLPTAARRDRWVTLIDEAVGGEPEAFPKNGWVVHAFQAALAAIVATPVPHADLACTHARHALTRCVRLGGDTDTVAAIAGALLGARWGVTAVPMVWRRALRGQAFDGSRWSIATLERQARLAFRGGRPDGTGWPSAPSMLPHYAVDWPASPLRLSLGGVEFGNVHAVADAVADGADVVVSLCRMGTDDVPDTVEHHVLGLLDTTPADNPNVVFLLADLLGAIDRWTADGRRVYVHCVQAQNRTPTVALAWLVHHEVRSPADALDEVSRVLNRPKPFLIEAATRAAELAATIEG